MVAGKSDKAGGMAVVEVSQSRHFCSHERMAFLQNKLWALTKAVSGFWEKPLEVISGRHCISHPKEWATKPVHVTRQQIREDFA
jgi:hypothetical protein